MRRLTVVSVAFPFALVTVDPVGGAEQVLAHLDHAVMAAGHRSIVVAAEGSQTAGELVPVPQPQAGIGRPEWERAHRFLRQVLPELVCTSGADLVHMHGLDYHDYLPPPGVPVLATLHLPLSFYDRRALDPQRPRTWLNAVSKSQLSRADGTARLVGAIENGIELAPLLPAHHRRGFALAVGRICPEKGFHLALEAAKLADIPLRLAGQVFTYPEHQRYFDSEIAPRLDGARRWIGPVSGPRKWRLLRSARCLLAPSLVPETASLVAREALAAGTPVIAFPNGALADVVEPGRTGFLVRDTAEMAEAIVRAPEIRPEACRRAAQDRFSVERMTGEYLDLYERLVEAV